MLQAVAIVALAGLAWRKGGLAIVAIVLAANGLAYATVDGLLLEPWNPYVSFPYFGVLLLLAWSITDGDLPLLPFAMAVGTFLIQTHVGYAPLVLVAIGFAVLAALITSRRSHSPDLSWKRPLWWSSAVLAVAWAPTVAQELFRQSNLSPLARFMRVSPHEPYPGLGRAAGTFAEMFTIPPPWLGGRTELNFFNGELVPVSTLWMVVPVVLLIAAGIAVWRSDDRRLGGLVGLIGLLTVTGVWSISRVAGPVLPYIVYWRIPLAIVTVAVALGAWWYASDADRYPVMRRAAFGGLVVVLV